MTLFLLGLACGWVTTLVLTVAKLDGVWPFRRRRTGHEWLTMIEQKRRAGW